MARSLNKAELIGNLTRDPELRYTPQGTAVCTFGIATNRYWNTESGEKKEDVEFHRIVAWNKLGELCGQLLGKGKKVYVEGRLQTRKWTGQDGAEHTTTEIVINDMIILDSKGATSEMSGNADFDIPDDGLTDTGSEGASAGGKTEKTKEKVTEKSAGSKKSEKKVEPASDEDIPF
jgi:single-strand DNA-binding protein